MLLAVAENAGDTLERALQAAGARCTRLDVYRTVPAPAGRARRPLSTLRVDNVVLASPSAVTGFVHQVDVDVPAANLHDRPVDDGSGAPLRARRDGRSARAELGRNFGGHAMAELIVTTPGRTRLRRLRRTRALRNLVAETSGRADNLIMPHFVLPASARTSRSRRCPASRNRASRTS